MKWCERRRCVVGGVGLGHGARVMAGSRLILILIRVSLYQCITARYFSKNNGKK